MFRGIAVANWFLALNYRRNSEQILRISDIMNFIINEWLDPQIYRLETVFEYIIINTNLSSLSIFNDLNEFHFFIITLSEIPISLCTQSKGKAYFLHRTGGEIHNTIESIIKLYFIVSTNRRKTIPKRLREGIQYFCYYFFFEFKT